MTREELLKKSWKGFEEIEYSDRGTTFIGLLVSIDFDGELMVLQILETSYYQAQDITVNIKYCRKVPRKMKAV